MAIKPKKVIRKTKSEVIIHSLLFIFFSANVGTRLVQTAAMFIYVVVQIAKVARQGSNLTENNNGGKSRTYNN